MNSHLCHYWILSIGSSFPQEVEYTQYPIMTEVRVHAAFTCVDEEKFLKEVQPMIAATQTEKGCIHYQIYKEKGKEKSYAMIETWASAEELKAHSQSQHVKNFQASQKDNGSAVI